jgi:uncharacterized membrane protein
MNQIIRLVLLFSWIAGIVIAKGFWSTFFAVIFPLWGYYLLAERVVEKYL